MNPLSPLIAYRRHKGHTVLLLGIIGLMTAGLYLMVTLSWAIFVEPIRLNRLYLTRLSVVRPTSGNTPDPGVIAQLQTHSDIARVIPGTTFVGLFLTDAMGVGSDRLGLFALGEEDVPYVMERYGATLSEGQMLVPRTNGILLSESVAANLGLQVGDVIHNTIDPRAYNNIMAPMQVVGILQSDVHLGILSYEYLSNHESYRNMMVHMAFVAAKEGCQEAVERFLRDEVQTPRTDVWTLQGLAERMECEYQKTYLLLIPIVAVVAVATTLVVGAVNRIALAQRIPEFGILYATGRSRQWLKRHLTIETAGVVALGWGTGIAASWLILYALERVLFAPRGHALDAIALAPVLAVLAIPIAVIGSTRASIGRTLARLDPVSVIERGELNGGKRHPLRRAVSKSTLRPLASWTFYDRHRGRAALLTATMALMILAVAMVTFVIAATYDAQKASLGDLRLVSNVRARPGVRMDPGTVAQVRTHPTVERVIPYTIRMRLDVHIPPFGGLETYPYGVYAEDMAYLVDLYGLELKEGRLPSPHTNEMVIAEATAENLGLAVGDPVRDPGGTGYGIPNLRAELVISGIFARPAAPEEENLLSFIPLEYLESDEAFGIRENAIYPLLVVPKPGQKAALDDWLENELASEDVWVSTCRSETALAARQAQSTILTMAWIESIVEVVAAAGLAVLNHIFVAQRRSEFGLLHALGHGRWRLVWRTVRETAFTTGTAWGLGAVLCLIGLLYMRFGVFEPLGLRFNPLNLTPWLFTLPIPVAVLLATSGTIVRTLSRLDCVSIIERGTVA